MNSAIYQGAVRHRRLGPVPHAFRYRLFMLYLDLEELPRVFDRHWLWSARRPAVAWFRRADYLGDPAVPLDQAVRDLVAARTGHRPSGPIRLLTHLRYLGYVQNPVSFYFCFDPAGRRVESIVADITNTPWGERHAYVVEGAPGSDRHRVRLAKAFHVSPFMPMTHRYDWRFSTPDRSLVIHMENLDQDKRVFDATLVLRRRALTGPGLAACLVGYPWMTARVGLAIYWQALRLWLKGAPFYPHPHARRDDVPASIAR